MGTATAEAPPPPFGGVSGGGWAARSDAYAHAAGLSTSGRTTLPSDPSPYDPPRTSRLTRSTVRLGDPLSPFVSEVMRPQGILQEKKYEVPVARARYSKGRDTPSRGESEAHVSGRAHPSLFQSNSSMTVYASTKARLRAPEPWHDVHPREFKRASRRSRPSDRRDMVQRLTLEEARTPLERRRALEHEAALFHAERRRVAALDAAARAASSRRAAAAAEIKDAFSSRREANEQAKNRAYAWEEDPGRVSAFSSTAKTKTTQPRASKYEAVEDALEPAEALTRGARQKVPRPRVVGPCAFVPLSADAYAEARRAQTVTDERRAFADEAEALRAAARRLGGAAPGAPRTRRTSRSSRGRTARRRSSPGARCTRTRSAARCCGARRRPRRRGRCASWTRSRRASSTSAKTTSRGGWWTAGCCAKTRRRGAGGAEMSSVRDGANPQASMVRARAAADARLALANRRGEWTDASSEEGDAEPDSRASPEA